MAFRVRTGKRGLELRLHDLEATIMSIVWGENWTSFAVSDVHRLLERDREIAYTTVMTTLGRLHEKGLLVRSREGKRYLYSARWSRERFLEQTAREVLEGAIGGAQAMAMLAEKVSEASLPELDELETLIQRRRGELGG